MFLLAKNQKMTRNFNKPYDENEFEAELRLRQEAAKNLGELAFKAGAPEPTEIASENLQEQKAP
jgi:hypothetical protein